MLPLCVRPLCGRWADLVVDETETKEQVSDVVVVQPPVPEVVHAAPNYSSIQQINTLFMDASADDAAAQLQSFSMVTGLVSSEIAKESLILDTRRNSLLAFAQRLGEKVVFVYVTFDEVVVAMQAQHADHRHGVSKEILASATLL